MHDLSPLIRDPAFVSSLAQSLSEGTPPPTLRCAKIKITSRCNLRCSMCRYWKTQDEETLESERWREVFAELAELGCRKIHFSGGEALLRKDFPELAADAAALGLKVSLTTNGTLLTKDVVRRLVGGRIHSISLSLDGPTSRRHDAVRGRSGAFRRTVRAIERLRKASPDLRIRINTVLMRDNWRGLPGLVRLAGELGATDLVPMPVDEKGPRQRRLSRAAIRTFNREVAPVAADLRKHYGFPLDAGRVYPFGVTAEETRRSAQGLYARGVGASRPCLAPWLHLFLAWNGDAFSCCMTNGRIPPLGNVGEEIAATCSSRRTPSSMRHWRRRATISAPRPASRRAPRGQRSASRTRASSSSGEAATTSPRTRAAWSS
jgi:MoaA/NifB/PqqE/SkfB family radical SAM enzyme